MSAAAIQQRRGDMGQPGQMPQRYGEPRMSSKEMEARQKARAEQRRQMQQYMMQRREAMQQRMDSAIDNLPPAPVAPDQAPMMTPPPQGAMRPPMGPGPYGSQRPAPMPYGGPYGYGQQPTHGNRGWGGPWGPAPYGNQRPAAPRPPYGAPPQEPAPGAYGDPRR